MKGDETWDEYMARNLQDPEYAAAHAVGRPFSNLALNVWSLREAKGMTQQQLAETAKMKQPRIADIERDEANPTLLTISRVAVALGVTAARLLAEPDEALLANARSVSEARTTGSKRRLSPLPRMASAEVQEPVPEKRRATGCGSEPPCSDLWRWRPDYQQVEQ